MPPQNKPTPAEIATCRPFLAARIAALPRLCAVVCLGRIAHETLLRALGAARPTHPFAHGARHAIGRLAVFDSYHCSRLQHQHRPPDRGDVRGGVRRGPPPLTCRCRTSFAFPRRGQLPRARLPAFPAATPSIRSAA